MLAMFSGYFAWSQGKCSSTVIDNMYYKFVTSSSIISSNMALLIAIRIPFYKLLTELSHLGCQSFRLGASNVTQAQYVYIYDSQYSCFTLHLLYMDLKHPFTIECFVRRMISRSLQFKTRTYEMQNKWVLNLCGSSRNSLQTILLTGGGHQRQPLLFQPLPRISLWGQAMIFLPTSFF